MHSGRNASILFVSCIVLGGCASMSAEECAVSDWHTIGFEDGAQGHAADRLGDHRRACADHGIAPNLEAYRAGRQEGLQLFCQPSRGFDLGARGGRYNGVCAANLEPAFLDAYRSGFQLYTLQSNVSSATNRINSSQSELKRTRELIREKEAALIDREATPEERVLLLADLKELAERTGELEAEIDRLIDERARHEEHLASYQAYLADAGY